MAKWRTRPQVIPGDRFAASPSSFAIANMANQDGEPAKPLVIVACVCFATPPRRRAMVGRHSRKEANRDANEVPDQPPLHGANSQHLPAPEGARPARRPAARLHI